jgi:hypothetical protein
MNVPTQPPFGWRLIIDHQRRLWQERHDAILEP